MGPGGTAALTGTFLLRCLMSPFAHPLFTACTGLGVGIAVSTRKRWLRVAAPVVGYLWAVTMHGLWNSSTLYGPKGFFGVYVVLMLPAFVLLASLATWARSNERRMLINALNDAAARGLIPGDDIGWVVELRGRRESRRYARQYGGPAAERAMRDYQQAAIEIGYLHHRFLRGTAPPDFAQRGQTYVDRIAAVRPWVFFPGQAVPVR